MKIITFDIEEWALVKANQLGAKEKYAEYDDLLNRILMLLEDCNIKATFFCTGMMAEKFPQVVRLIYEEGHEIGCHSYCHTWMNKMTISEAREDTHSAVDALEQCIGQKIVSYRAPAFSIGDKNKWMFELLVENGIQRDASVFPATRDFGGFPKFGQEEPCIIEYNGIHIKEFPLCTAKILGKDLAYSGGGYFRFFPIWFVKNVINNSSYSMCYFHIGDLISESHGVMTKESYEAYFKEPGTLKARYLRYIKSNIGKKGALKKLERLVRTENFDNLQKSDEAIEWNKVAVVKL